MEIALDDAGTGLTRETAALLERCTTADDHAPFGEHTLLALHGQRQVRHALVRCLRDGRLVGCAALSEGIEAWYVELAVDPDTRGQGVGTALVDGARAHVLEHGGGVLRTWAHARPGRSPSPGAPPSGWSVQRSLHVLDRRLVGAPAPLPVPAGLRLRPLDPSSDGDRDSWLALSNAAFAGHPENGGWDRSEVDWRMQAAWTDGARFPVLEDAGGALRAGVWTKREPGETDGELYVVAVDPAAQGQGLGRVVVTEALRDLHRAGCRRALLYVDEGNVAAQALYARAGFGLHHVDRCLQQPVGVPAPMADHAALS